MILTLLVITDGCRFCNIKKRTTVVHVGSHFSLGSTAQLKLFVFSRVLANFFNLCNNLANLNISHGGAAACRHLWTMVHSLYITRCRIDRQCKSSRSVAVMWSYLRFRMTRRAAAFRTDCTAERVDWLH